MLRCQRRSECLDSQRNRKELKRQATVSISHQTSAGFVHYEDINGEESAVGNSADDQSFGLVAESWLTNGMGLPTLIRLVNI